MRRHACSGCTRVLETLSASSSDKQRLRLTPAVLILLSQVSTDWRDGSVIDEVIYEIANGSTATRHVRRYEVQNMSWNTP